eukprot:s2_g50.t1
MESPEEELLDLFTCHRSDKELPFPWARKEQHPVDQGSLEQSGGSIPSTSVCQTFDDFRSAPDLSELQQQCEALGCISFQLPKPFANAGAILKHAIATMDALIRLESPLIFKVGFTTDVVRRWTNTTYGYSTDPAKWSNMIVLLARKEPFTPAMLEAALVDKYKSIQGCRNVRSGGDTVDTTCSTSSGAQFMTYAPCAGAIRTAQNIVKDFGRATASSSGGLVDLAGCTEKNSERDSGRVLVKKLKLSLDIPKTYLTTQDESFKLPVLRMRSWVEYILRNNCWHVLTGLVRPDPPREKAILKEFWRMHEKMYPNHPIFQMQREGKLLLERTAPCVVHGDEGRGRKRSAFMCLNFHSLLGRGLRPEKEFAKKTQKKVQKPYLKQKLNFIGHSLTHRFLLASMPKKYYTGDNEHVWEALVQDLASEIQHMYTCGVTSPQGEKHWIMTLNVVGDWPFLQRSGLLTRTFNNVQKRVNNRADYAPVCHLCCAGKANIPYEEIHTRNPKWLATMHQVSPFRSPPALLSIPHCNGEAAAIWAFDLFHSWHLGGARNFLGSVLALLSGREQAGSIDERFELLTKRYLEWCKSTSTVSQVSKLTKECIQWPKTTVYPSGGWHKGALSTNLMHFFKFLVETEDFSDMLMLVKCGEAAKAINNFLRGLYTSDLWLQPNDAVKFGQLGMQFLRRYSALASEAHQNNQALFILQPKLHVLHHCFLSLIHFGQQNIAVLSPLAFSVQPDEDFVGRPSRLSRRVSARTVIDRVLTRYMQACFEHWVSAGWIVRPEPD